MSGEIFFQISFCVAQGHFVLLQQRMDLEPGLKTEQRPATWSPLPLPFATRSHPRNEMSVGLRLLWIFLIATGAAFSAGMYLAGLESLARLLKG